MSDENVPGLMAQRDPDTLQIFEIGSQTEATVTARRPPDTTLVEGNALEFGQQWSVGTPHVVRHSGPSVQEKQRFTVSVIPFDREDGTTRNHARETHAPIVGPLRPPRPGPSRPDDHERDGLQAWNSDGSIEAGATRAASAPGVRHSDFGRVLLIDGWVSRSPGRCHREGQSSDHQIGKNLPQGGRLPSTRERAPASFHGSTRTRPKSRVPGSSCARRRRSEPRLAPAAVDLGRWFDFRISMAMILWGLITVFCIVGRPGTPPGTPVDHRSIRNPVSRLMAIPKRRYRRAIRENTSIIEG